MTHDDNALRAALAAATDTIEPSAGFAERVMAGGRRRLRRRRAAVASSTAVAAAAVIAAAPPVFGRFSTSPEAEPEPRSGADECAEGYADQLPVEELPTDVRLLWSDEAGGDAVTGYSRWERSCGYPELMLTDIDDGAIARYVLISGPEQLGFNVPAADEAAPLDPGTPSTTPSNASASGSAPAGFAFHPQQKGDVPRPDYRMATWPVPGGQLRIEAEGFTEDELRELAAAVTLEDGAVVIDDEWAETADVEYVEGTDTSLATRADWTVEGSQVALYVVESPASGFWGWGHIGDPVVEVNGEPALLKEDGAKLGGFPGSLIVWSPADGVIAELSVAEGLDPVQVAESVQPVAVDDPRLQPVVDQLPLDLSSPGSTPS